jgi:DNA repair protein RadC
VAVAQIDRLPVEKTHTESCDADRVAITGRLREVGDLIGIRVLDPIIIGDGHYFSFADSGTL